MESTRNDFLYTINDACYEISNLILQFLSKTFDGGSFHGDEMTRVKLTHTFILFHDLECMELFLHAPIYLNGVVHRPRGNFVFVFNPPLPKMNS
jgi:hypothetical protein